MTTTVEPGTPDPDLFPPDKVQAAYRAATAFGLDPTLARTVVHALCEQIADHHTPVLEAVDDVQDRLITAGLDDIDAEPLVGRLTRALGFRTTR